ncbi:PTS sugar transporter subunit IIA [Pectinatus frisingensis]|uniref:PTS sugar transporter subunit IIA n=1 Tax=Pectinatus frisingensis TaxID=865 RepID=UPI0018C76959|nr:PTS sugar transporter subunit IIA [Pectinatus frisingensis]
MIYKKNFTSSVNIFMGLKSVDKVTAITQAGRYLVDGGFVKFDYIDSMVQRENLRSTYIGKGIAISHGMPGSEVFVHKTGICILQFPEGVDYEREKAYLVIGLAINPNDNNIFFSKLSDISEDSMLLKKLFITNDKHFFYSMFGQNFREKMK